ncbi:MAG: OST-HTH/LOTUS domain-containing protein [Burkholderiaceae bacterium]|nr:OST-HTH/LOTUS domain-containing protein [Burkholderiaceae bacterium]
MKSILAHHELAGPVETLEAQRAARVEKLADKTLGTLVKVLFDSYAVADGYERDLLPDDTTPTDRASMAVSHRLTMEPERLAETKAAVEELVAMRNQLVHHLIEQFDLWSEDGCAAAMEHLEGCYARIDHHHRELVAWADGMEQARALMASFAQTEVFHDLMVNGIAPDGSFSWRSAGIVRVLRQAAKELSEDGWTSLERARRWMEVAHPEQTPSKYGCRTWPQVLTESRQFDLAYRVGEDGRKAAWFRLRSRT